MDNWKKALVVGSAGIAAVLFMKGKRPAGMVAAGVGLLVLATEYPETFEQVANLTPGPLGRGLRVVDWVSKAGETLAERGQSPDQIAVEDNDET